MEHKYERIGTAPGTEDNQKNKTVYVRPEQNLKVALEVTVNSGKNYAIEFLLEKDFFEAEWQWWALLVKVKLLGTYINHDQVKTVYELQVRTSTCLQH